MGQPACPRTLLPVVLAAVLGVCGSAAIGAEADYCVTCKNPDQVYRCRLTGVGSRPSDALKLYCVIRTAQEGNHASCAAEKANAACNGLVKVYDYDGPTLPQDAASDPRVQALKQKIEQNQQTFEQPKDDGAPKTLFQLGGRAVDASRKGLRNAGSALGVTTPPAGQATTGAIPPATAPATTAPPPTTLPPTDNSAVAAVPQPAESPGVAQRATNAAQNAGSAVGSFTRRSYRCVLSLFRSCSEE